MPLKVSDGMKAWISDFENSDAPQFKGKSEDERRKMAIAAYMDAKRGSNKEDVKEAMTPKQKAELAKQVAAFKAKGGSVKKLAPGKAQGYHGKDDPGKDMHGMMDKGDTRKIGTRKKVKSMEATQVDEMQIYRVGHRSISGNVHAKDEDHAMEILRKKGVKGKITLTHRGAVKDRIRNSKTGKPMAYAPNESVEVNEISIEENYVVQKYIGNKKDGPAKSFGGDLKKATAHATKMGKDYRVHKESTNVDMHEGYNIFTFEGDNPPFAGPYKKAGEPRKDRFGNTIKPSNVARHLARSAAQKMADKQKKKPIQAQKSCSEEVELDEAAGGMFFKVSVSGLPDIVMIGRSPGDVKSQLRKIVKQPSMITDVERMTRAEVKKRYRDLALGDMEDDDLQTSESTQAYSATMKKQQSDSDKSILKPGEADKISKIRQMMAKEREAQRKKK
jgi:hypothetical protein